MMEYQPFQWSEFHGGITNNVIDTVPIRYAEADNFVVTENRKLFTRDGSEMWNPDVIPAGNQRINAEIDHFGLPLIVSAKKIYYSSFVWQTITGFSGNDVFSQGSTTSIVSWAQWNNITYVTNYDPLTSNAPSTMMKIYTPTGGSPRVVNAMLPAIDVSAVVVPTTAGTNNYIYDFVYSFSYEVQGVTLTDFGAPSRIAHPLSEAPNVATVNISNLPVLSNGASDNYRTTEVKIIIYRTVNNGTQFFKVGEVTNGTTTFNDNFSDATIANNALIYTDGGQVPYQPAIVKSIHITNSVGYAGNIIDIASGELIQNKILQSIPGIPHAFNSNLFVEIDDDIVGISSVGETPVILCKTTIYRLDGTYNSKGESTLKAQKIESTVGCIGLSSIVQIQRGVVFAGEGGFYYTDGWEVRKISQAFNKRYQDFTLTAEQKRRVYGTFDRFNKRVAWSVQEKDQTDVNKVYLLDSRYGLGIAGDDLEDVQVCFTTWSGGANFAPTAGLFINGEYYRADKRGYVLIHKAGLTSDLIIDTTIHSALWDLATIMWRFRTMASSMGTPLKKKFIPKMVLSAQNVTNISIQITGVNDVALIGYELKPIRFRKNCIWGDISAEWSDDLAVWYYQGMIEETRFFQSEGLRCNYKQIEVSNAYVQIFTSDSIGTATVNAFTKTVILDDIVNFAWPEDIRDHYIYFEASNYLVGFKILSRTPTTVVFLDTNNLVGVTNLVNSRFSVKGYPKDEILNLLSLAVWYSYLGEPNQYKAESAGNPPG